MEYLFLTDDIQLTNEQAIIIIICGLFLILKAVEYKINN